MAAKRLRNSSEQDPDRSDDKRIRRLPSFATVIREAVMAQSLKNFSGALEPLLRRVVQEEVERGLVQGARSIQRYPQKHIQVVETSSLRLIFSKPLSLPIFTGSKIEDEENNPLQILLIDTEGGERSIAPLTSPIKLEIVVIDGDFSSVDGGNWTSTEFNSKIVKERTGRRPLLAGDVSITLRDGIATIGELMITDNSSWIRSRKFRIGVRVLPGSYEGPSIREAMTEPFVVKDHRGELYRKHYPPALRDEVWRLEKIGKDGVFHKKLAAEDINTVQDFLKLWVVNPNQLRTILGVGMSDRMWEGTLSHARTCEMGDKLYLHHGGPRCTVLLNPICQVVGTVLDGLMYSPHKLTKVQRAYVEQLVLEAYREWNKLEEADGLLSGNTALLQNEPTQYCLNESSSGYANHQESTRIDYQSGGFDEVGSLPSGLIQTPTTFSTLPIQTGHTYNLLDFSSHMSMK